MPSELTAEQIIGKTVSQTVSEVMKQVGPMIQPRPLDHEALATAVGVAVREANKPYEDPVAIARELRERAKSRADHAAAKATERARQNSCQHKHKDGQVAINLQHNFPDINPRGICPLCQDVMHPTREEVGAPTAEFPNGKKFVTPAHPQYQLVLQKESMS